MLSSGRRVSAKEDLDDLFRDLLSRELSDPYAARRCSIARRQDGAIVPITTAVLTDDPRLARH